MRKGVNVKRRKNKKLLIIFNYKTKQAYKYTYTNI